MFTLCNQLECRLTSHTNSTIRLITFIWFKLPVNGAFDDQSRCVEFWVQLEALQKVLWIYSGMLEQKGGVEEVLKQLEKITVERGLK